MHRNYYLSRLVADDLDGSGLQLEKIGQLFQVLTLKQNRGAYWNRGADWDEGAYAIGALINKNTFEAGR